MKLYSFTRTAIAAALPAIIVHRRVAGGLVEAFAPPRRHHPRRTVAQSTTTPWRDCPRRHVASPPSSSWTLRMSEEPPDESGADLAAQFFKAVSERNISFEGDEIDFADAEEDELLTDDSDEIVGDGVGVELDDDDDAILREYDVGEEGSLTDGQIYDEMKDRVFESAGAFVELTKGAATEDEDEASATKVYVPPTNVPDSGLTAGEVVELVLSALRNNDVPTPDYGVQILFGYSSTESQIVEQIETEGLTPAQYRQFLLMSEDNMALFDHADVVIDKADYSPDRLKGYFTARLMRGTGSAKDDISVNFILSTTGTDDDDCWLIDTMLIRPSKLRRRRRR